MFCPQVGTHRGHRSRSRMYFVSYPCFPTSSLAYTTSGHTPPNKIRGDVLRVSGEPHGARYREGGNSTAGGVLGSIPTLVMARASTLYRLRGVQLNSAKHDQGCRRRALFREGTRHREWVTMVNKKSLMTKSETQGRCTYRTSHTHAVVFFPRTVHMIRHTLSAGLPWHTRHQPNSPGGCPGSISL